MAVGTQLGEAELAVVDGDGEIVHEGVVLSEPVAIAEFIKAKAVGAVRVGLETGPPATWLCRHCS